MKLSEEITIDLHPFESATHAVPVITCAIARRGGELCVAYAIQGDLKRIFFPPSERIAARRDHLWESTCLECFVAEKSSDAYWEFNVSPAGLWNAYHFDAYRQGMREEIRISGLPCETVRQPHALHLSCIIDLHAIGLAHSDINIGPAAVIIFRDGPKSYWAPVHLETKPDFHRRDAFVVQLHA